MNLPSATSAPKSVSCELAKARLSESQVRLAGENCVVRSYLDQLVRLNGIAADCSTAISAELDKAMLESGTERTEAVTRI